MTNFYGEWPLPERRAAAMLFSIGFGYRKEVIQCRVK